LGRCDDVHSYFPLVSSVEFVLRHCFNKCASRPCGSCSVRFGGKHLVPNPHVCKCMPTLMLVSSNICEKSRRITTPYT
jgi:hypothetical protein